VKFPYRQEPSTPSAAHPARTSVARPRIRIRLVHKDRFVDLLALVDSGADDSMFPLEVAEVLDLPLDPKNANRYGGIGSGHITAFFTRVTVDVGGVRFPLYAGFSDAPSIVPILGQGGFFDVFEVRFNRPKEVIELKWIQPK